MNTTTNSQDTLNTIVIDILRGAKEASGEIYTASKAGIIKGIDFAQEQTPLVVEEFCRWKFAESIIDASIQIILICFLAWLAKKSFKWYQDSIKEFTIVVNALILAASIITSIVFVSGVWDNAKNAIKIKIAPRVYLIDYVAEKLAPQKKSN